jgi:hypothetical protein
LPKFPKLWIDLVEEEIILKYCSKQQREVDSIGLVRKQRRVARKATRRRVRYRKGLE